MSGEARRYRFDQLDRSGVLLGLNAVQLVVLGFGMATGAAVVSFGLPGIVGIVPPVAAFALAFGRIGGQPVTDLAVNAVPWIVRRGGDGRTWTPRPPAHQAYLSAGQPPRMSKAAFELPPVLEGLFLLEADSPWHRVARVGLLGDRVAKTLTVLVPVRGRDFALLDTGEQEGLLDRWGETLASFTRERGAVARLTWSEFSAPAGIAEHRRWLDARTTRPDTPDTGETSGVSDAMASYVSLLDAEGVSAADHQVTLAITVAHKPTRGGEARRRGRHGSGTAAFVQTTIAATETLLRGLRAAGLQPAAPCTATEIAEILRWRTDPEHTRRRTATRAGAPEESARSTSAAATASVPVSGGLVGESRVGGGPGSMTTSWTSTRTDGALHRCFWIADWPRLPVRSDWFEPLLANTGGTRRAFTIIYEPVAPSTSRRRIDSESIKLESDAVAKADKGRRVTAQHRRNQVAVAEREQELVAGFVEFDFTGLVTITATTEPELWDACDHVEQVAREHGLDLRALDGRHDLAWAAALPFGIGINRGLHR